MKLFWRRWPKADAIPEAPKPPLTGIEKMAIEIAEEERKRGEAAIREQWDRKCAELARLEASIAPQMQRVAALHREIYGQPLASHSYFAGPRAQGLLELLGNGYVGLDFLLGNPSWKHEGHPFSKF